MLNLNRRKIAPISWIKKTLAYYLEPRPSIDQEVVKRDSSKVLLGIPFHGIKISNNKEVDILTGEKINSILKDKNKKMSLLWNNEEQEHQIHYFEHNKECNLFFPSKKVENI